MSRESVILYCSDEFAFGFVPALSGCGLRIEVIREVSERDRGRNLYPEVKVFSENVTITVRGFPPQPPGERNRGNGRNALVLQYSRRDESRYSDEFRELLQSIKAVLLSSGAEMT